VHKSSETPEVVKEEEKNTSNEVKSPAADKVVKQPAEPEWHEMEELFYSMLDKMKEFVKNDPGGRRCTGVRGAPLRNCI
jgi:hypothetical protein